MSGQAIQFFIQMSPIFIGALSVLVLKSVKFPEPGIGIRFFGEVPGDRGMERGAGGAEPLGHPGDCEDAHERAFERLVRDELISNGLFSSKGRPGNLHKVAFEKLGILDGRSIGDIMEVLPEADAHRDSDFRLRLPRALSQHAFFRRGVGPSFRIYGKL